MMWIPCDGPSLIYGDNQSVMANPTIPDSMLKKKLQSITYHFVHEGSACDVMNGGSHTSIHMKMRLIY